LKKALIFIGILSLALTGCKIKEDTNDMIFEEILEDYDEAHKSEYGMENGIPLELLLGDGESDAEPEVKDEELEYDEDFDGPYLMEGMIANNGGYIVKYGNEIIFRIPNSESLGETYSKDSFIDDYVGKTTLYRYSPSDGELNSIYVEDGYGPLVISSDKFYTNQMWFDQNGNEIGKYVMYDSITATSSDSAGMLECNILLGTDSRGINVVMRNSNDGYIVVLRDGATVYSEYINRFIAYVGCERNRLYYIECVSVDGYDRNQLSEINLKTGEKRVMGYVSYPPVDSYEYVEQFEMIDGKIYFSLSFYAVEDYEYAGTVFCAATAGKSYTMRDNTPRLGKDEKFESTPAFRVKNDYMKQCDGVPGDVGVDAEGNLGYYDEKGKLVKVTGGFNTKYNASRPGAPVYMTGAMIDGQIYVIQSVLDRYPYGDTDTKEAYIQKSIEVLSIDTKTGERTSIISY